MLRCRERAARVDCRLWVARMRLISGYEDDFCGGLLVGIGFGIGSGVLVIRLLATVSKHVSVSSLVGQN